MNAPPAIADGMELIRWTLTDRLMIRAVVVKAFASRWRAIFDIDMEHVARLPWQRRFSGQRPVDVLLTSVGIQLGNHGFWWREPRRYCLKHAFVDHGPMSASERSYARLRLVFAHRFFPPGGTPKEIDVPIVEELVEDVIELVPTLKTLGNPPMAESPEAIVKRLRG